MLHPNDFRSIWEVSHLWAGHDPSKTDPENLPDEVIDRLHKLIWGNLGGRLPLRKSAWWRVPNEDIYLFLFNLNRVRVRLRKMIAENRFDKGTLEKLYVNRSRFIRWCEDEYLVPPKFWAPAPLISEQVAGHSQAVGKHKNEEIDRQVCQAIARTLWDFDPHIHPAHMAKHKAIQKYGNGAMYKDEETVRNWIAEVDPLKKERKTGRPPTVRYFTDMDNGGFSKDCVIEFKNEKNAS